MKCVFKDLHCIPMEQPDSPIIWDSWESLGVKPHDYKIYHPMGTFPVKQVDNYFLVPGLGIGGAFIKEEKGNFLLDTGYIVIRKTGYPQEPMFKNRGHDNMTLYLSSFMN